MQVFQTSKQTLSRESDSFLARLVSDDQSIPIEKVGTALTRQESSVDIAGR